MNEDGNTMSFRKRWKSFWRRIFQRRHQPRNSKIWRGDYPSWKAAEASSHGYDAEVILEKCRTAGMKVKRGEAAYERDSVLFDQVQYSWGLLAGLQLGAARSAGCLSVMDFGGSLGSTYFQNLRFLERLPRFEWNIVEQAQFVRVGQADFQDEALRFHHSIDDCVKARRPNVAVLSSSLQYLPDPHAILEEIIGHDFDVVILDRTPFIASERDLLTVQTVPASIYQASYPAGSFREKASSAILRPDMICLRGRHHGALPRRSLTPHIWPAGKGSFS
jgi:putative methyltransferase (TIGR04325 family)